MILTSTACISWAEVRTSPRAWPSHPLSWMPGWHLVPLGDLKFPMASMWPDQKISKEDFFLPANKKWALICGQLYSYKMLQNVARSISLAADRSRACIKGSSCVWSLEIEIWFALWFYCDLDLGRLSVAKANTWAACLLWNSHKMRIAWG